MDHELLRRITAPPGTTKSPMTSSTHEAPDADNVERKVSTSLRRAGGGRRTGDTVATALRSGIWLNERHRSSRALRSSGVMVAIDANPPSVFFHAPPEGWVLPFEGATIT